MQLAEFFGKIGFYISEDEKKKLKDFDDGIKGLGESFSVMATAGAGALYLIDRLISKSTAGAASLRNFQVQTGQSAQALQQFQLIGEAAGVSREDQEQSIRGLSKALSDLAFSGKNANIFKILGITDFTHGTQGVIDQLQGAYKTFGQKSPQLFSNLIGQIGLPPSLLSYFAQRELIEKELKTLGVTKLSNDELNRNADLGRHFQEVGMQWSNFVDHFLAKKDVNEALERIIINFSKLITLLAQGAEELGIFLNKHPELKEMLKDIAAIAVPLIAIAGTAKGVQGVFKTLRLIFGAGAVAEGAGTVTILGSLVSGFGELLLIIGALALAIESFPEMKKYFEKNPDAAFGKYNPFYYAGAEAVKLIYGKDSPEYKAVVKKTAGMWGEKYDDGSDLKTVEDRGAQAWKDYKAGHPQHWQNKPGVGWTQEGGANGNQTAPTADNALPIDGDKPVVNIAPDNRPALPDFALSKNAAYQPIEQNDQMMSGKDVMKMLQQMNMNQTNNVTVNAHGMDSGSDAKAMGNIIAGQIGTHSTGMISDAYDQLNNGGF